MSGDIELFASAICKRAGFDEWGATLDRAGQRWEVAFRKDKVITRVLVAVESVSHLYTQNDVDDFQACNPIELWETEWERMAKENAEWQLTVGGIADELAHQYQVFMQEAE